MSLTAALFPGLCVGFMLLPRSTARWLASFLRTSRRAGCTSRRGSVPRRECKDCGEETFTCPKCGKCGDCCECEEEEEEDAAASFQHAVHSKPTGSEPARRVAVRIPTVAGASDHSSAVDYCREPYDC